MAFELLAQSANVNVDRPVQHDGVIAEGDVDQLGSRERPPRLPDERGEQLEFARREIERAIADRRAVATAVDHKALADEDVALADVLILSPQEGVDPL